MRAKTYSTDSTNSDTLTFSEFPSLAEELERVLKDVEFADEWYKPTHMGSTLGLIRKTKGISQKQLAKKIGTKQEGISRAEKWDRWTSLRMLHKMANALDCYLDIQIKEKNK